MNKKTKEEEKTEDTMANDTVAQEQNGDSKPEGIPQFKPEDELNEELSKEKDKFLRLFAEFENFKKRTARERIELFKSANQDVMLAMLPIIDDFDRALIQISKSEDKEMLKGVELISDKFRKTLQNKGLEEVTAEKGDAFDADIHEAITQIPVQDDSMKGKIVDVIEKGYKLGDKIIRHPKVVVGQ